MSNRKNASDTDTESDTQRFTTKTGTTPYMSPEIRRAEHYSYNTDCWFTIDHFFYCITNILSIK